MDYEKKYNEALERAKYYHDRDNIQFLENIFHELEESEDERIRKSLIDMLKNDEKCYLKEIAWLEKQGEHSVSPLFTFEDVLTIQCAMAYAKFQDRELDVALKKLHDKVYDAYHDSINHNIESQDGLKGEQIPANSAKTCKDEQKPAEWSDKDDLRYCIDYVRPQHPTHDNGSVNIRHYRIPSFVGDKGAESILSVILSFGAKIVALYRGNVREGKLDEWKTPFIVDKEDWYTEEWLKSLKDRIQPQDRWKPSDEQIDALEHFVRSIGESGYASPHDNNTKLVYSLLNDLKKLREE